MQNLKKNIVKLHNNTHKLNCSLSKVIVNMTSLTLGVQQSGDAQFPLCHVEGLLQILLVALSVHLTHVNQSGPAVGENSHYGQKRLQSSLTAEVTERDTH